MNRRAASGRNFARTTALAALVLLAALLAPLQAQEFGRWWWDGLVGWRSRSDATEQSGVETSDYGEREFRVELGVNGYLLHPSIGRFRLGVETSKLDLSGDTALGSDELGWSAELDLLPRGPAPLSLSWRRGRFDYQPGGKEPAFVLGSSVDTVENGRGRLRVQRGVLAGTIVGADVAKATYLEPGARAEESERLFLGWNRKIGKFENSLRVDRDDRQYGRVELDTKYLTATFDQFAQLDRWFWQLDATALRADTRYADASEQSQDEARLMSQVQRDVRERDRIDLRADLRRTDASAGASSSARRLAATYRWRPGRELEVAPLAEAGELVSGPSRESFRRGGLALSWLRQGSVDWQLSSEASYGTIARRGPDARPDERDLALAAGLTVGGGSASRLRRELELGVARNQLRFDSAAVAGLPPAEAALLDATLGLQDSARARVRLDHQGMRAGLGGWVDWTRARIETVAGHVADRDSLGLTVEGRWHQISLLANSGRVELVERGIDSQSLEFVGASLDWRLARGLTLRAHHRTDRRELRFQPDLHSRRDELGLDFRLGLLRAYAGYFEAEERIAGGDPRLDHGLRLSLVREFSGQLPVVTGSRRRGEIR